MTRAIIATAACLAIAACTHKSDVNAPGLVELERWPYAPLAEGMEQPADPGERIVTLNSGVLAGLGGNAEGPHGDFAIETTLNWGENDESDEQGDALLPQRGFGVTLGWSALRVIDGAVENRVETGPIYVEVQRFKNTLELGYVGFGVGWAVRPDTGDTGPQINAWLLAPFFCRARYLIDGGFEMQVGLQLKFPVTWTRSR